MSPFFLFLFSFWNIFSFFFTSWDTEPLVPALERRVVEDVVVIPATTRRREEEAQVKISANDFAFVSRKLEENLLGSEPLPLVSFCRREELLDLGLRRHYLRPPSPPRCPLRRRFQIAPFLYWATRRRRRLLPKEFKQHFFKKRNRDVYFSKIEKYVFFFF